MYRLSAGIFAPVYIQTKLVLLCSVLKIILLFKQRDKCYLLKRPIGSYFLYV